MAFTQQVFSDPFYIGVGIYDIKTDFDFFTPSSGTIEVSRNNKTPIIFLGTAIHPNFDIEVTYGMGTSYSNNSSNSSVSPNSSSKIEQIFGVELIAKQQFYDALEGFVRIGYTGITENTKYPNNIEQELDRVDLSYGVGLKYKINEEGKIRILYNKFHEKQSSNTSSGADVQIKGYGVFYEMDL